MVRLLSQIEYIPTAWLDNNVFDNYSAMPLEHVLFFTVSTQDRFLFLQEHMFTFQIPSSD